jgi:hypothetical protein
VIGIDIGKKSFHVVSHDVPDAVLAAARSGHPAKWMRGSPICRLA